METNAEYYTDLITRYLCGEATPDEIRILGEWVEKDPGNRELFKEYRKTWSLIERPGFGSSIDLDREWEYLRSKIRRSGGGEFFTTNDPQIRSPFAADRTPSQVFINWSLRIAAAAIILIIPAYFLYRYFTTPSDREIAAVSGILELVLPDGTAVTLNAGAKLTYPSEFHGNTRKVELQGEAWFDVAHDRSIPFIISAGNTRFEVVGTSFFINTNTFGNTREIILSTGHVKVYFAGLAGEAVMLSPGEKAEAAEAGHSIRKSENTDVNYLAWKTKHLVFDGTPLDEAVAILSSVYHTRIQISGTRLSNCRITSTFDKQSLESVLNVLKATLDLQIRNTGAGFEISGNGCK
jgi:transmembrane sensor